MTDAKNPTVPDEPKCAVCLTGPATKVAARMQGTVTFPVCDECFVPPTVQPEVSDTRLWRKKPVVVEAVQYDGKHWEHIFSWANAGRDPISQSMVYHDGYALLVTTCEGIMRADPGDWIIKGVAGEFYPCKPDIFAATYEPAARRAPVPSEPIELDCNHACCIAHGTHCCEQRGLDPDEPADEPDATRTR